MSWSRSVLVCVAAVVLAMGLGSEAFCGLRSGDSDEFVACVKAKAIATLDRMSRDDSLPLTGSVTLVRGDFGHRRQRSSDELPAVNERELLSKPDASLDSMLYDKAVGLLSGRVVRIGLPELTPDQIRTAFDEGRGKMKKNMMGMMMTMGAMKAMMIIPLALGMLFLVAGKALIISKIALILSLIITLKKLMSKSGGGGGGEHMVHETHMSSGGWPSGGSSSGGGGWDKRSSSSSLEAAAAASQMLAYSSYNKP